MHDTLSWYLAGEAGAVEEGLAQLVEAAATGVVSSSCRRLTSDLASMSKSLRSTLALDLVE